MDDPAKDEAYVHLCPHCKKPVPPGFRFCELCGAKITSVLTCSKCGTQFVHPKKYCDCCGARFVPKEILEAEGAPEEPGGEGAEEAVPEGEEAAAGLAGEEAQEPEEEPEEAEPGGEAPEEPEEEPAPEPEEEEAAEPEPEEEPEPVEEEPPKRKKREERIPDTKELLETYGKEFDDNETIGSARREKRPAPARKDREFQEGSPDALVPAERERRPAKIPAGTMRIITGGVVFIVIFAAVYFIAFPLLTGSGAGPAPATTPSPGPTVTAKPGTVITPDATASVSGPLVPQPTETVPDQKYYFQVKKNPVTYKISVIFIGSASPGTITSADVKVTRSDGLTGSGTILPLKGVSEIFLNGTNGADRVEIIAKMASGKTYRVYDALVSP